MSPALAAAFMSTLVSLSTTSSESLAAIWKPFKAEVRLFVASSELIMPSLLKYMDDVIRLVTSLTE